MKNHKLAIVIPAYKNNFFRETLDSIANQSCKDFTLYIGDDNSPNNLYDIVNDYKGKIEIVYKKFEENLGGRDLVSHWERCINLIGEEEWIWLFSDDDLMDTGCVNDFYNFLRDPIDSDVIHFNINIIDESGQILKEVNPFPKHLSVSEFFSKRIRNEINSAVIEFIFKKSIFIQEHGFTNFDLAWCSDDATWIKFANERGITTIGKSIVRWRYSGVNISSNVNDKEIVLRKLNANTEYLKWIGNYLRVINISNFEKVRWATSVMLSTSIFSLKEKIALTLELIKNLRYPNLNLKAISYVLYMHLMNTKRNK